MRLLTSQRRKSLVPVGAFATALTTLFYDPLHLFSIPLSSNSLSIPSFNSAPPPPSAQVPVAAVSRSWRDELELVPEHDHDGSRTLGFSKILTIALPGLEETRGMHMDILGDALDLDITPFPGTLSSDPIIAWIAERVLVDRLYKNQPDSHSPYPYESSSPAHEGLFWPVYLEKYDPVTQPDKFKLSGDYGEAAEVFERLIKATGTLGELEAFTEGALRGAIACWHAHVRALLWIERTPGIESALILEDDVDIEFDIKRLWGGISLQLPAEWDLVYLGYVWSQENLGDMQTPVALRKSSGPLGTMAYAASKSGATKTLANLRSGSPYTNGQLLGVGPFGQPLDNALRALISQNIITSYSVSPPLITHPGLFSSAIGVGGSAWNGTLIDSTVKRVCRHYKIPGIWSGECFHGWRYWIDDAANQFRAARKGRS